MFYVRMTDKALSGWGCAAGMTNVLVIACDSLAQAQAVERAAQERSDMIRVRIVNSAPRARSGVLLSNKRFSDLGGPWLDHYASEQVSA